MPNEYKVGDLVWAKTRINPTWPGKITNPDEAQIPIPKPTGCYHWIYFYGTYNYNWVEESNLKPYAIHKNTYNAAIKNADYHKAREEIEAELAKLNELGQFNVKETNDQSPVIETENTNNVSNVSNEQSTPTPRKPRKKRTSGSDQKGSQTKKTRYSSPEENNRSHQFKVKLYSSVLNHPSLSSLPEEPKIDFNVSEEVKSRDITASNLRFGFLGLGIMGSGIVKNLITSGHKVNVYSRTQTKAEEVERESQERFPNLVHKYQNICDVVDNSDIIFVCVSDPAAVDAIVNEKYAFLYDRTNLENKGYVEMSSVDAESSTRISQVIKSHGGRYLEAQLQGSKNEANEGNLFIMASGDRSLYEECSTCFRAISRYVYFLGDVGFATKINLILQSIKGVALLGLAEGLALADQSGLKLQDVIDVFNLTNFCSPYLSEKAELIEKRAFENVSHRLEHMQKDLRLALELADSLKQPLFMVSTANEIYKHTRRLGYDSYDAASVFVPSRH